MQQQGVQSTERKVLDVRWGSDTDLYYYSTISAVIAGGGKED